MITTKMTMTLKRLRSKRVAVTPVEMNTSSTKTSDRTTNRRRFTRAGRQCNVQLSSLRARSRSRLKGITIHSRQKLLSKSTPWPRTKPWSRSSRFSRESSRESQPIILSSGAERTIWSSRQARVRARSKSLELSFLRMSLPKLQSMRMRLNTKTNLSIRA